MRLIRGAERREKATPASYGGPAGYPSMALRFDGIRAFYSLEDMVLAIAGHKLAEIGCFNWANFFEGSSPAKPFCDEIKKHLPERSTTCSGRA